MAGWSLPDSSRMGASSRAKPRKRLVLVPTALVAFLCGWLAATFVLSHDRHGHHQGRQASTAAAAAAQHSVLASASDRAAAAAGKQPAAQAAALVPPITVVHAVDWIAGTTPSPAINTWKERGCMHAGQELDCSYHFAPHMGADRAAIIERATAVAQHVCQPPPVQVQHPVVRVLVSLESAANYPCMNAQAVDVEMSYRGCSQVWSPYFWWWTPGFNKMGRNLFSRPLPFAQKKTAIAYINSNCNPRNNRMRVMKELGALLKARNSSLEVHSYGACDNNMGAAASADLNEGFKHKKKIDLFRQYKFCVAMENSAARDYVSEKLWDSFVAGCVPLYLGAPNVNEHIPTPSAIINYDTMGGSVQALADRLEQLAADEAAYEAMLAWKQWPHRRYPPRLQTMLENNDTTTCHLCRYLAAHPPGTPQQGVPCSVNTSWSDA